jgi:hypothetical protein
MTKTAQDIIAGVEVLTTMPEWVGGGAAGGTKMTVSIGESGATAIIDALDAAGSGRAADRVQFGHQSDDRQGAWP